jgi:hypothetical protein
LFIFYPSSVKRYFGSLFVSVSLDSCAVINGGCLAGGGIVDEMLPELTYNPNQAAPADITAPANPACAMLGSGIPINHIAV